MEMKLSCIMKKNEIRSRANERTSGRLSSHAINSPTSVFSDSSRPDKQCVFALLLAESICKEFKVKVS